MTREQALTLRMGQEIHANGCSITIGPRGGRTERIERWRVNGKVKTWKRDPSRIEVPLKHGFRTCWTLTASGLDGMHLPVDCPCAEQEATHTQRRMK